MWLTLYRMRFVPLIANDGEGLGMFAYMAVVFVLEIIFGILASTIATAMVLQREYSADAGAQPSSSVLIK